MCVVFDVARTGKDETAIVVIEQLSFSDDKFICFMEALNTPNLMQAVGRVAHLDRLFNFKKIIVDETGMGAGVTDLLKEKLGGRVEGITFTNKSKGEMFNNLKIMMQNKVLYLPEFIDYPSPIRKKLYYQLLGINYEYSESGNIKITHDERNHDDLVCALALAAMYFSVRKSSRKPYSLGGVKH